MQCEMAVSGIEEGDHTASYPFRQCREDDEIISNLCRLPVRTNINVFTDVAQYRNPRSVEHGVHQHYGLPRKQNHAELLIL
jgi:hypothetical protein